jgi:hypothetical protein
LPFVVLKYFSRLKASPLQQKTSENMGSKLPILKVEATFPF